METSKLELKDICGYLPYGLKGQVDSVPYSIIGIETDTHLVKTYLYDNKYNDDYWNLSVFQIILRPLSDLYKTITHNGKEIVPIVECAKISFSRKTYSDKFWKLNEDRRCAECEFPYEIMFFYEKSDNNFKYSTRYSMMQSTNNQYQLFDYLHEIKIDYRGLIDAGLAIDINTLNENPYK